MTQVCLNQHSDIPIIGASGAVCGLEGVYLTLALRWPLRWPDVWPIAHPIPPLQLGLFAALGAALDIYSLTSGAERIAYGAHVGGFLSGLVIATVITQIFPTDTALRGVVGSGEVAVELPAHVAARCDLSRKGRAKTACTVLARPFRPHCRLSAGKLSPDSADA